MEDVFEKDIYGWLQLFVCFRCVRAMDGWNGMDGMNISAMPTIKLRMDGVLRRFFLLFSSLSFWYFCFKWSWKRLVNG